MLQRNSSRKLKTMNFTYMEIKQGYIEYGVETLHQEREGERSSTATQPSRTTGQLRRAARTTKSPGTITHQDLVKQKGNIKISRNEIGKLEKPRYLRKNIGLNHLSIIGILKLVYKFEKRAHHKDIHHAHMHITKLNAHKFKKEIQYGKKDK